MFSLFWFKYIYIRVWAIHHVVLEKRQEEVVFCEIAENHSITLNHREQYRSPVIRPDICVCVCVCIHNCTEWVHSDVMSVLTY